MFGREKYRFLRDVVLLRPALPFALDFTLLAPLALWHDRAGVVPAYVFVAPWLAIPVIALHLPLFAFVFGAARIDLPSRRNHALEHATIQFLRSRHRVEGRAERDGFRVSGGPAPDEIRTAFEQVAELVRARAELPHISPRCGSNRVTALALGALLLALVTLGSIAARPPLSVRAIGLLATAGCFVALRHSVGNWVQRRFFMATDFSHVAVHDIRKVKASITETAPVYFVETRVG